MLDPFFDELSDGICVSDAEGRVLYMNPAAERMLDASVVTMAGTSLCDLLCGHLESGGRPECASACALRDPGSGVEAVTFHGRHGPKDIFEWRDTRVQKRAEYKDLRVRCLKTPATFLGEGRHLTLIEDAGPERELERRIEDWRSMIAHDLRAPLTNMVAALAVVEEQSAEVLGNQEARGLIQGAARAGRRMTELLDLYLEIARFDAGAMPVQLKELDVEVMARTCIEEQASLAAARGVEVQSALPPGFRARADENLLFRVLQNLLNNAVKFTPRGGRVTIVGGESEAETVIRVTDTGPGISPDDEARIFDRFYQARARRAGRIQGNGLGLTFCREALRAMGGSIDLTSELGAGCEFAVRLPRAPEAAS